jgi:hypothetical protein
MALHRHHAHLLDPIIELLECNLAFVTDAAGAAKFAQQVSSTKMLKKFSTAWKTLTKNKKQQQQRGSYGNNQPRSGGARGRGRGRGRGAGRLPQDVWNILTSDQRQQLRPGRGGRGGAAAAAATN